MSVWNDVVNTVAPGLGTVGGLFGLGGSNAPPTPDYVGAANLQGEKALENTRLAAQLNRPNVNTPLGSQTWTTTGPDQYQQDITLSKAGQGLFDTGLQTQQMMADTGLQQLGQAKDSLSQPLDLSQVGGGQQHIEDALYNRSTRMLDPQFQQAEARERDRLANQGFQTGTAAYDTAMGNFDRSKNNAYGDARDRAIAGGVDQRKQAIQEALLQRQTPLNEVNALRTGSQVQMPSFQQTPGVQPPETPNILGATAQQGQYDLGTYNTGVSQQNALIGGLFNMGAAAVKGSDIRLKSNIVRVGTHRTGIGIYEYDIFGHRERGVMAQEVLEVMPHAVLVHPDGYLMVNYIWLN